MKVPKDVSGSAVALMRLAAIKQAEDRAARAGEPCYVSRKGITWYVTTRNEPTPAEATTVYVTGIGDVENWKEVEP